MRKKSIVGALVASACLSLFATESYICSTQNDPPGSQPCQCFNVPVCAPADSGTCTFPNGDNVWVTCICNGSQQQDSVAQCQ